MFGGLAMFLFGMEVMGEGLKKSSGDTLRVLLQKLTRNTFTGLLTGMLVTAIIQASSATIVLTVGLLAVSSHILLDAMTNGGLGVAAFWPFDQTRYFCDWRPIRVSPFGLKGLLSQRGLSVMLSELRWVWAPCLAVIAAALFFGKNPMRAIPRK